MSINCTADPTEKKNPPQSIIKKRLRPALLLLLILFAFLFAWRFTPLSGFIPLPDFLQSEDERFVRFTEQIFRSEMSGNTLNLHYTIADPSAYDIDTSRVSLGDASLKARQQGCTSIENYLKALSDFDYEKLSAKHQLTYDIFQNYLETELSEADLLLYDEPLSPTLGIQAQLPVVLAEYTFRTKGDIEDYLCLLSQIPDYFSSILSFERDKAQAGLFMSDDCALEVIRQCKDFLADGEKNYLVEIFDEKIDAIRNLTADEKIGYKSRNKSVVTGYVLPAYETLISGIAALEGSGTNDRGLAWFPKGTSYYEYLVKSSVGDDRPIEEIEEQIKSRMVADYSAIQSLAQKQAAPSTGTEESSAAADTEEETPAANTAKDVSAASSAAGTSQPALMLDELREKITADFPVLPGVSCVVKYVHPSLQAHLSPAFYLTPAIDDYKNNVIYINPASDYSELELFTTLAHEGYPGHLYQSVYFHAQSPDLLRCLLDTGGYTEGWATYVEMYAYGLWDGNPETAALGQKNRSFTLGLASLLDIGIHYHGYSLEQVEDFLGKLGFSEDTARSLYQSILQSPANYLKYYVGYLNFCSLRDTVKEKQQADFSLKEFHRFVLDMGPAPFSVLQKYAEKTF